MQTGLDNGIGDWRSHIFFFWLGIVGTVGSLIGIVLSFYFYQESQIKPLLTFSVHPLKTELQRPDFDKELGFIYKGVHWFDSDKMRQPDSRLIRSNSKNAVSFSSARTFSHSPKSNGASCASASVTAQDDSYTRLAR